MSPTSVFLRNPRYERWRWQIAVITWLAYVGYYFTRKSFAVAKVGILQDPSMALTKSGMGLIDLSYGIAYAAGMFLCGYASDRFGPRRVVLVGMAGSILVSVQMGFTTNHLLFGALFFVQGLCQSSGWAPLTKNVSSWFSRTERGRVFGIWSTNYAIGGMLASSFAGYAAWKFGGWQAAFTFPAIVLLVILVLFWLLQRNCPEDENLPTVEEYHGEPMAPVGVLATTPHSPLRATLREVSANPMILRLAAIYFLIKPIRYAMLFWGPLIVYERIHTNIATTAFVSAFFEGAGPVGVILAGFLSDKIFRARRIPVVVLSLFGLALTLFAFNPLTESGGTVSMALMFAAIGVLLFGPDTLIASTCAVDFGKKDGVGSAAGFINGVGSVGQILGLWLPGMLSERFGWGALFNGMAVFILLAALFLLPKWNAVPVSVAPAKLLRPNNFNENTFGQNRQSTQLVS